MNLMVEGKWWARVLQEKGLATLLENIFEKAEADFEIDMRSLSKTVLKSKNGETLTLRHWRDGIAQVILQDSQGEFKIYSPDGDWTNFIMTKIQP